MASCGSCWRVSRAVAACCYSCRRRWLLLGAAAGCRRTLILPPVAATRTCVSSLLVHQGGEKGDGREIASTPVAGLLCPHKQEPGKRDRKTELKNRILETQAESPSPSRLSQPIAGFGFSGSRAHWSFF
ncbi:hypothetical protein BRADI_1g15595v3 [Brachypodium distachyon]|uniref:Uncharacterized protein n=1 Tax=Brachypodium distachyon TaxID=15368 RepID=A0A0Q3KTC2_BRADI|nr:hypothetical protein BRADI_1g15595v3 [Brachypodium distachyon]KQK14346.1 hypothetical protein BRADI_1g15595v3 [Brachypodium distachyon]